MTTRLTKVDGKAQVKALPNRAVNAITARELRGDQRDRRAVASGISDRTRKLKHRSRPNNIC